MKSTVDCIAYVIAMGILATAFMDLWAMAQKRLLGIPSLDYAMVGRWLGHMPRGIFLHTPIGTAKRVPGEVVLGWSAHYAIGMLFAAMFVLVMPDNWRAGPTLLSLIHI